MTLLTEFAEIQKATDIMMENVKHLHDVPAMTIRKAKK